MTFLLPPQEEKRHFFEATQEGKTKFVITVVM